MAREESQRNALESFLEENRADMLECLESIVADLKATIEADPVECTDYDCEEAVD